MSTPASSHSVGSPVPRHDRFSDGSVKASGFELDGKLHGHWEWFRLDGSLMRSGEFDLGHQVGLWRTWDRAGRLVKETTFGPSRPAATGPIATVTEPTAEEPNATEPNPDEPDRVESEPADPAAWG